MYRRYLKLEPTHAEEFIAYLKIKQLWGEAAKVRWDGVGSGGGGDGGRWAAGLLALGWAAEGSRLGCAQVSLDWPQHQIKSSTPKCPAGATSPPPPPPPPPSPGLQRLADVVNDEGFRSLEGKSKHQLWLELCDLVTKHPNEVKVRGQSRGQGRQGRAGRGGRQQGRQAGAAGQEGGHQQRQKQKHPQGEVQPGPQQHPAWQERFGSWAPDLKPACPAPAPPPPCRR